MVSKCEPNFFTLPDLRVIEYELSRTTTKRHGESVSTILLANSICAPYATWDHIVPALLVRGYDVLRYNQPGHGKSTAALNQLECTTFTTLAQDVVLLLDSPNIERLKAWIGVSMGAATGIYVAVANPGLIEKLVICDTLTQSPSTAGVPDTLSPRAEALKADHSKLPIFIDGIIERWFSLSWRDENPDELARVRGVMMTTTPSGFRVCVSALTSNSFDLRPYSKELSDCVEAISLIVGELDGDLPQTMAALYETIQQGFAEASDGRSVLFHTVPGAGHLCYVDNPSAFLTAVSTSLNM